MLVVRHKITEAEKRLTELEKKFLYDTISQFKFVGPQTDIPEDIILVILGYLGKITARLNTKYYNMWLETRGLRLTTKRVLMGDFNIRFSEYVRCLEINTDFDEFIDYLLSEYDGIRVRGLEVFTKLDTIEIHDSHGPRVSRIYDLDILEILCIKHNEILKRVKKINMLCTCHRRFQCIIFIDMLFDIKKIDRKTMDKITFVHKSSGTSFDINELNKSPWDACDGIESLRRLHYNTVYNKIDDSLEHRIFYHPVDIQYYREILEPLFSSSGIAVTLYVVGKIEKPIDYTPKIIPFE